MRAQRLATAGHHFAAEQSGKHAIFLGRVVANGQTGGFFPPDGDFVLLDQLANVFETHRSLVELDFVVGGHRVDQVRGRHGLANAVLPATCFHQVVEEQRNNVVRLQESAVGVNDAEPIRIPIRGDPDMGADAPHFHAQVFQQFVVGLRRMIAEEHIAIIVHSRSLDTGFPQKRIGVRPRRAPHGIESHAHASFADGIQVHGFAQPAQVGRLRIERL